MQAPWILVVDDDDRLRRDITALLRRSGYRVTEAGTGKEAVRLLEESGMDLIVTDINMPDMDGIELIVSVSRQQPPTPVVAISGGGYMPRELLLANADLLGAVETIAKPFEASDLLDAVRRALAS
ncbi:MAG: response regulator [Longimicrobiales bacterium]|nr:response regulator [Longimicrobiales bacterium]